MVISRSKRFRQCGPLWTGRFFDYPIGPGVPWVLVSPGVPHPPATVAPVVGGCLPWYTLCMIDLDAEEIEHFETVLRVFASRSYPFAVRQTLNATAWDARSRAQHAIARTMTERNKWTRGSVRVVPERGTTRVSAMEAAVGSTETYMETQETGGSKARRGRHGVAIPTSYAAGQEGARPRTRLPRGRNKLRNIKLQRRSFASRGRTRAQRIVASVQQAIKSGKRYVYMDFGQRRGIVRVLGGKRRARLKMVYDLSSLTVRIPRRPWLEPAVNRVLGGMDDHYRKALIFQLRRRGLY